MEQRQYLEFDLMLERTDAAYRARVLAAPAGMAVIEFDFPFSELEVENFVLRMGRSRQISRRVDSSEMAAAREFGTRLYDAVFVGTVRSALDGSLMEAAEKQAGLRIRLRFSDNVPELIDLPWEFLYNPDKNRFLSLSSDSPLVRDLDLTGRIEPLRIEPPVRVLVMISSPTDFDTLDVDKEWRKLKEAVADLEAAGRIVLDRTEAASLSALQRQLRREEYHIFHFIGHGGFDSQADDGFLVLEDENGRGRKIGGQQLAILLHDEKTLRLAILNACEGGRTSYTDPFAGVAQSLLQQDLPAVIAMQFEVSDEAAITLAHEFYAAIADGYPADAALSEARKSIYAEVSDVEWGKPVLYMRAANGRIFDVVGSPSPVAPVAAVPMPAGPPPATPAPVLPAPAVTDAEVAPEPAPQPAPAEEQSSGGNVRKLLMLAGIGFGAILLVIGGYFLIDNLFGGPNPPPTTVAATATTTAVVAVNPTVAPDQTLAEPTATATVPPAVTVAPAVNAAQSTFSRRLKENSASHRSLAVDGCALRSRLWVGATVYFDDIPANTVRDAPGKAGARLGEFAVKGDGMRVIDGPVCADGWVYWKVVSYETRTSTGAPLTGWTAEGDESRYWLVPLTHPFAYLPGSREVCPGAYASRLQVGDTVVVTYEPAYRNIVRASAYRDAKEEFRIEPGEPVTVIGGPECADGWVWWQIRDAAGKTGWTSEGDADIHWLLPINELTGGDLRSGSQGTMTAWPLADVKLDAAFDEWPDDWQPLTVWSHPTPAGFGDGENLSALAQVAWQDDGLLFALRVTDDIYNPAGDTALDGLWRRDGVEILFDAALGADAGATRWSADDHQIVVGFPGGNQSPLAYQFNNQAQSFGAVEVQGADRVTADGYDVEFLLPWAALGLDNLRDALESQPFGFALSVNDWDDGASLERIVSSSPERRVQNEPTQWGTLLLAGADGPVAHNFGAVGGACDSATAESLAGGIKKVCVSFDYHNIPPGASVVREWNFLGTDRSQRLLWVRYECAWDKPVHGRFEVDLREPGGLHSGIWEMSVLVDGEMVLRGEVDIPGSVTTWLPEVNTKTTCD